MLSVDRKARLHNKTNVKPLPVSVVDVLSKRCHSKRVLNPLHNLSAVTPGRMHALQFMCACRQEITLIANQKADINSQLSHLSEIYSTCICPTKHRTLRVISQAIWQAEIIFNQHPSVGSIHPRGLNLWGITVPISPV